ncbi:MAG: nitronate monooxygenase [Candidatus Sphingomonas colombiensis]|nr:nitronate monooxygenase [Sphingomonas sp.]WEK41870.1 MAG: nitronate monooxygenase [Sphingomonas sp.]
MAVKTRVTEMLGIEKPIVQAAMGWIARAQLASAVSNAGGMGIIETSSGQLDAVRDEIVKMRALTDKPFGVNVAQAFVRDPDIVRFVIDQGVKFVTTSAGDPMKYTAMLKDAGLTVFHVVPNLAGARRAVEAGVDGLIVEGGEGGGFKNPKDVSTMVLVPQVVEAVDVPVIAAGGIIDGKSMAAAFALGAEGVLMGTRILSSAESPVHDNWKQAIINADATDTVFLNRKGPGPALRALRTDRTTRIAAEGSPNIFGEFADTRRVYFEGDLEAGVALTGQVAGRIHEVKPVAQILDETMRDYAATVSRMAGGL